MTSLPIRPMPMTATRLSKSSLPVIRFHCPDLTALICGQKCLLSAIIRPSVCSATVVWLTPGVKRTGIFLLVAYVISIESRPMPYFAITLSCGSAASITFAVISSSPLSRPSKWYFVTRSSMAFSERGPLARIMSKLLVLSRSWCLPGVS